MSRRIVRVDQRNGSSTRGYAAAQRLQVQMPAMIVEELIGNQPHVVQPGQEIEQRVAGLADQHLFARVAEQPEQEAVGLAGAGGEKDLIRIYRSSMVAVIEADRLAGGAETPRFRFVAQRRRIF